MRSTNKHTPPQMSRHSSSTTAPGAASCTAFLAVRSSCYQNPSTLLSMSGAQGGHAEPFTLLLIGQVRVKSKFEARDRRQQQQSQRVKNGSRQHAHRRWTKARKHSRHETSACKYLGPAVSVAAISVSKRVPRRARLFLRKVVWEQVLFMVGVWRVQGNRR